MTMVQFTPRGLPPQEFRPHCQPMKLKAGSEGVEYLNSPEKNLRQSRGSPPGGLWMPNRVGRGMTAQLNDNMITGGCLTKIARENESRNYVNGPLPGSTNPFAFPRPPLLRPHIGMVLITTPLTCPQPFRTRQITCWKGAQMRHPGSKDKLPTVPRCRATEGRGDSRRGTPVHRSTREEIGN